MIRMKLIYIIILLYIYFNKNKKNYILFLQLYSLFYYLQREDIQ